MAGRFLLAAACAASSLIVMAGIAAQAAPRRAAATHRAAPASRGDWTRTVVATPEGGYRMGNPAARVKLVEYGSISCPHCARFARESLTLRSSYVKSGKVSWEYRPFLLFPTDPGIFMLLRCQGAAAFFPTSDRLYAEQSSWENKIQAMPAERQAQIVAMAPPARITALTLDGGLDSYFRTRMAPARIKACLADDRNLKALLAISERGNREGVQGTPTFFINGKIAGVSDWAGLEPMLKSAGG